jgi:hypothetical protein
MVVQDLEPFRTRADQPDVGWCYATVEVESGSGILTSATVIDANTNENSLGYLLGRRLRLPPFFVELAVRSE